MFCKKRKIPLTISRLHQLGDCSPSRWYGNLDTGEPISIKYRHGILDVEIDVRTFYYNKKAGTEWSSAITLDKVLELAGLRLAHDCYYRRITR